jgi:hypothetical protein
LNCREGWGVEPPVVCLTLPNKVAWDTLGGQFQPPPLLMMLNRLCVMTMTINRHMSTPHLFFDNSNPGRSPNGVQGQRLDGGQGRSPLKLKISALFQNKIMLENDIRKKRGREADAACNVTAGHLIPHDNNPRVNALPNYIVVINTMPNGPNCKPCVRVCSNLHQICSFQSVILFNCQFN